MKKIFSILILFISITSVVNSARADNLCDAECTLTITFPNGGSITAVDALTITFGDDGLVDTGATSTPYVDGNTLVLGVGEVLTFGVGGSFDLGAGGNFDSTNFTIVTTGDVTISAVGGASTINLFGSISADSLILTSGGTIGASLTLSSDLTIDEALLITNTGTLNISGDVTIDGAGTLTNAGTLNITSGTITLNSDVDVTSGTLTSTGGTLIISTTGSLTTSDGVIVNATLSTIDLNAVTTVAVVGVLTITPTKSGAINFFFILLLVIAIAALRYFKVNGFSIR